MNIFKSVCLTFIFVLLIGASFIQPSYAGDMLDGWVANENVEVTFSNPVRSRRNPNATLDATVVNASQEPLIGPVRFVITVFTPDSVSLANSDGQLAGNHYYTLIPEGSELAVGASIKTPTMTVVGGGSNVFSIDGGVYTVAVVEPNELAVDIVLPETLLTVGASPVEVSGTINNADAQLTLNGVPIAHQGGKFKAAVELTEGFNTIAARATSNDGQQTTDSIVVSLDLTPPYLTIESHKEAQTVYSERITVTGLVNDIVRGTVEAEQAKVQVNGIDAKVSNRSYAAHDILLTEGSNIIKITGADNVGNNTSISQTVIYKIISGSKLNLVSGQDQSGEIGSTLAEELIVQLVDANNNPIANETVVFRVVQGAGAVGAESDDSSRAVIVKTNVEGKASTKFQLGFRTGVANHKVKAKVVGYENDVIFSASATSVVGDKISVNSGNNQRGVIGQALPAPFIVAVSDSGANTVKGARVRFDVIKGDGLFQNEQSTYEVMTDSDGRASAQLTLGPLAGIDAQRVEAVLIDSPEGVELLAGFSATAFIAAEPGKTSVSGVVLDNQDTPIPGVTVRIENTDRTAKTNQQGRFTIEQAPVGPVHIIVDGSTATVIGEFPSLSYHLVTVSGVDNPMSSPVYMVKLDTENGVMAGKEDVVLTLDNFPGFKLEIAKDSVTFPDGSREGIVSVTSVNASKVPMAPPNGMQPQFIVTIQPVGAVFFPAAKLTLPNIDGHAPGAQVEMYSFDHDLEEFVAIGLGTVSEDGSIVSSNPGVGVIKAGWHCGSQPGGSGTAHNCPTCQKCKGSSCVRDPAQDKDVIKQQTPEDCKTNLCKGTRPEPSDIPVSKDVENDCKKPGCNGDSPVFDVPDDNDISEDDKKCSTCSGAKKIVDEGKEGLECSDGSTEKACYTCKDGSCGNHCDASSEKTTKSIEVTKDHNLFSALRVIQAKVPFMKLDVKGSFSLSEEQGEKCCKDCSKGADPKQYTKTQIKGSGSLDALFIVPGLGLIYELPSKNYGPLKLGGGVEFGPGAKGTLGITAAGETEKSECKTDDCSQLSLTVAGTAAIGIFFKVEGKVESCNIFDEEDCSSLLAGEAEAASAFNFSANAVKKQFEGEACTKESCYSYSYGKAEFKSEVKYKVTVAGIYKYQYENDISVTLGDAGTGGTCG